VTSATSASATQPAATAKPAGAAFFDAVTASKSATYKVTYKMSSTSGSDSFSGEQTWYVKGALSRFDFGTPDGTLSVFSLTDGSYICTGAGGQTTCLGTPKAAALQGNPAAAFGLQVQDRPGAFDPTFEGNRTIAGQSAQCFAVKNQVIATGEWRICYSSSGVPLLVQTKDQGFETVMEATAFSTTVADSDFKLPATPIKLGAP